MEIITEKVTSMGWTFIGVDIFYIYVNHGVTFLWELYLVITFAPAPGSYQVLIIYILCIS